MTGDITRSLLKSSYKSLDSVELPQPPQMPPLKDALPKLSKREFRFRYIYLFIKPDILLLTRLKSMKSSLKIWTQI